MLLAGEENQLILNDYRQSNRPGWDYWDGCIFLGFGTSNNYLLETLFPRTTTMNDQILDFGYENKIVGMPPPPPSP